nr:hypothetical protein [Propionicimonas sp.]
MSVEQVLAYLEAVPERYRVAPMVSAWCALRSGEVRGLRRSDVNLSAETIEVVQAVSRVRTGPASKTLEWRIAGPKTKAGVRTVATPRVMIDPMRTWIKNLPVAGRDGWLFPLSGRCAQAHPVQRAA